MKLLAQWSDAKQKVRVTCIGIQSAGNTTISGADAIDHALTLYDDGDHKKKIDRSRN